MATNPLHIAIKRADLIAINALLKQPAAILTQQLNEYDYYRMTPLMQAVQNHHVPAHIVEQLIDCGAHLHLETKRFGEHCSIMSLAISAGDVQKVELLIHAGATLNYLHHGEYGPLLDAVHSCNVTTNTQLLALLRLLVSHRVDLNIITKYQESALRVLSHLGRFDAVGLLLEFGADASQLEWTPLAKAVTLGNIDDMKRCVETGSNLEDRDWWSRTPYLLAIQTGDIAKVEWLLKVGANPQVVGRCGRQPLTYAILNNHLLMLRWLLKNGEGIEQKSDFGETCLMEAVEADNADAVEVLLRAGAKLSYGRERKIPDHLNAVALSEQSLEVLATLQQELVESPVLAEATSLRVAQLLLDAGADPKDLTHGAQRLFLGYSYDSDEMFLDNTYEDFLATRTRVFGKCNPERMDVPFWLAMIRSGVCGYTATQHFKGPNSSQHGSVWCAQRYGQTITLLNDGRIVQIGGEHEDGYDPDFCIYNDVFVHEKKAAGAAIGRVLIYGYPEADFPPTDFHTANLMGKAIIVVGGLGYFGSRMTGETQVYSLDIETFVFTKIATVGNAPGWIYKHRAEKLSDNEIRIRGGTIITVIDGEESHNDNLREFVLDVQSGVWR